MQNKLEIKQNNIIKNKILNFQRKRGFSALHTQLSLDKISKFEEKSFIFGIEKNTNKDSISQSIFRDPSCKKVSEKILGKFSNNSKIIKNERNYVKIEKQGKPLFKMSITLNDNVKKEITIHPNDNPMVIASQFCMLHSNKIF